METIQTFWRWAWPPSWSNSPLWIVATIGALWFTFSVAKQASAPFMPVKVEQKVKGNAIGPNFLPVEKQSGL